MGVASAIISLIGIAAAAKSSADQRKEATKARRENKEANLRILGEQKEEKEKLENAPKIAEEKAKSDMIRRRKGLSKTVLTSKSGTESGTLLKKTLGGV